jgi:hypothetical protein
MHGCHTISTGVPLRIRVSALGLCAPERDLLICQALRES